MDYKNGKIYKLVGGGLTYYGSTCSTLTRRLCLHKKDFKNNINISSKLLFETGDEVKIFLVEKYPCADRMELNARERYWIENNECVNKNIPTRTDKEYRETYKEELKEKAKEYYEANKDKRKEYIKKWKEAHKEEILKQKKEYYEAHKEESKQYREAHKEEILKQNKERYKANKEEILKKMSEKITCECGTVISKCKLARHKKSKRHILATPN
jgi:hypothetical protein